MSFPGRYLLVRLLAICAAGIATCGLYLGYLQWSGNFHEVIPGEYYRSAQPTAAQIADYAKRYKIRTIVNLRGASTETWYQNETLAAQDLGITHVDFKMSATHALTPERAQELVQLLKKAQKPILVHCQAGADRSGLASVLYLNQVALMDEHTAEEQLMPILYGHVGIPYISRTFAMDESWENLERTFGLRS
ncbi:dual specificity protein phosphatase family protein [Agrobacterium sp. a22-2]|uniref:tyrosine-protein phosphatase n=1 Tax=Agrobacterium sp. a22-2 TaxID=2283840 RepID=UPI001445E420|nr:tyrosine-protein phosphatase [Agrobacterium sp. a22-2]NKN35126.1 dual specificity protein phosphatase family protein [Agrobacterium sp. a22-2]